MTKDSLVKGTIILMAAAFVARFLGVVQRVPLKHLLDDAGMATYGIAYNIYFPLLIIATAGIPSALSKLISERMATGRYDEAQRIYRASVWFAVTAGALMTVILYAGAPFYADRISQDPDAALAIRALAPALLLFPLIAIMRGYFQGRQTMMATGLSQIVEQILRVATAVGLAFLALRLGYGRPIAIAGASFGGVMGSVGAFAVMVYCWRKLKRRDREPAERGPDPVPAQANLSLKRIYMLIFHVSIPISLISLAVPIVYFIDSSTVIPLLKGPLGWDQAQVALGILTGRAQSLAGIPIILAIALSQSVVPVVSAAYARNDHAEVNLKASQALRISILTGLPMVLILSVAAAPVNGFLFADTDGTGIIALMIVASMFQIVMMTTGAILMGLGRMKAPTVNVFVGIAVKLAGNFLLAPLFGIYGIIASTILCFIVTMALNLLALNKLIDLAVLGRRWIGFSAAAAIMAALGAGLLYLGERFIHPDSNVVRYLLQSLWTGGILLCVYPVLLFGLKGITREDVNDFPRPLQALYRKTLGRFAK